MSTLNSGDDRPPARLLFRRLAAVLAVLCFAVGILFSWVMDEGRWLFTALCLFVGFVMANIAITGYWPPKRGPAQP